MKNYNSLLSISKVIAICLCLFSIGCSPKFYTPNTQNTPMLQRQGQANASVAGNGNQVELQGAYAATDHIGVQLNGGLFIPKDTDDGNGGSGNFIELGVGYYTSLSDKISFETYGLFGTGSFENHLPTTLGTNPETLGEIEATLTRIGIQPGINYQSRSFGIGLSSRLSQLSYSDVKGDLIFGGKDQVQYLEDNNSNLLIEPALTLRGGTERLKVQLQIIASMNTTTSDFRQDDGTMTIGLNYKL